MTNTGVQRALTIDTTRSTRVVGPVEGLSKASVALSRPIRRDAPPASTTAANGRDDVTPVTLAQSVDGPGVLATKQRLQCGCVVRLGFACRRELLTGCIVVGRLAHLAEDAHHHVVEVLLGQPRQR